MIADGYLVGTGDWSLRIYVTDLQVDRNIRVKGDLHIGGVMLKLVEDLDVHVDWSDHALWWPAKNKWLTRNRQTLDQYGVGADALLFFTPMHKTLRVQLPDLRIVDARVDFSANGFAAVRELCKELGISHSEELSFSRPLIAEHLKKNYRKIDISPRQRSGNLSVGPVEPSPTPFIEDLTRSPTPHHHSSNGYGHHSHHNGSVNGSGNGSGPATSPEAAHYLATSPAPTLDAKGHLIRPKNLSERARLNVGWIDSSLSLLEQDVHEFDLLQLRFKYLNFYDLNPKHDAVRINLIYEQAKWQLLTEELDCSEAEMFLFAALTLQINLSANSPLLYTTASHERDEDIDQALNDLESSLEGTHITTSSSGHHHHSGSHHNGHHNGGGMTQVPELSDYLKFMKPKRFTLKTFKRLYFVFRDTHLAVFKAREDRFGQPAFLINLRGSEVVPDVNLAQRKYGIRLEVPSAEGMTEYWLRAESQEQYAKWMAAFRLGAKGRTMADSSYESEVRHILDFLSMQHPAPMPAISAHQIDINPDDYIAQRFSKRFRNRQQIVQRILEAHANVTSLTSMDAKLSFIRAWQALPDFGITYFAVKFMGSKREEVLGIAYNRLLRLDASTGDHLMTWPYSTMKAWNVNWEIKQMLVQFEKEDIRFACLSADCKIVHEFIGGYIFLSMRSKDSNQTLNEDLFHKLTSGWN